jgi:hypothetical protein
MALTVRLSPETERALRALAKRKRMSRSDVVREALARYGHGDANADEAGPGGPYAAWLDVIGVVEVGARDPGRTTGAQFGELTRERARARRAR